MTFFPSQDLQSTALSRARVKGATELGQQREEREGTAPNGPLMASLCCHQKQLLRSRFQCLGPGQAALRAPDLKEVGKESFTKSNLFVRGNFQIQF